MGRFTGRQNVSRRHLVVNVQHLEGTTAWTTYENKIPIMETS